MYKANARLIEFNSFKAHRNDEGLMYITVQIGFAATKWVLLGIFGPRAFRQQGIKWNPFYNVHVFHIFGNLLRIAKRIVK